MEKRRKTVMLITHSIPRPSTEPTGVLLMGPRPGRIVASGNWTCTAPRTPTCRKQLVQPTGPAMSPPSLNASARFD